MQQVELIPSMQHDDGDGHWVFVVSAMGEAAVREIPGIQEEVYRSFARKISMLLMDCEFFGEDVVELVNLRLITEEGFIYAVSEEQEKTGEKGLTLVDNMFHRKSRSAMADKSGNSL